MIYERTDLVDLVAEARGAHRAVRSQYLRAQDRLEELKQRLAAAKYVTDYAEKKAIEPEAQTAVDVAAVELNSLRDEFASTQQTATELQPKRAQQERMTASLSTCFAMWGHQSDTQSPLSPY